MISANTEMMLHSAATLSRQADIIDQAGTQYEQMLRSRRGLVGTIYRAFGNVRRLERRRKQLTEALRTQSLFLRECTRRFRSAQSNAISRAEKL